MAIWALPKVQKQFNEERLVFQQILLEHPHVKKKKKRINQGLNFIPHIKIN